MRIIKDVYFHKNGSISRELWRHNDKSILHRENDLPAIIFYYESKRSIWEMLSLKPCKIGPIKQKQWYYHGIKHRIDNPAVITYHKNGQIELVQWAINGKLHRVGNPSSMQYDENGKLSIEQWLINGKVHREDAPAIIGYGIITLKQV